MIDNGRYQWIVGAIALVMVIAFSVVLYSSNKHHGSPGVPAGEKLPRFVAPLAVGGPDDSANTHPVCNPAKPAAGGLNICDRGAVVLDLFAVNGGPCVSSVSAMQTVAEERRRAIEPGSGTPRLHPPLRHLQPGEVVSFAAVAAGGNADATRALVRRHHWRIPVGIDPSGAVGELYDVTICPMIEIANASGTVKRLLVGERYAKPAAIAAAVDAVFGRG